MTIEERLDRLERKNRTLQRCVAVLMLLGIVLATAGATQKSQVRDVIRARAFHVVDDAGKVFARLEASSGEEMGVVGSLVTLNEAGRRLVQVTSNTFGAGMVVTLDGKGRELVQLAATSEGKGAITTLNGQGQSLVQLGVTSAGAGMISTMNADGKDLVLLTTSKSGDGTIAVYDPTGRRKWGVLSTRN